MLYVFLGWLIFFSAIWFLGFSAGCFLVRIKIYQPGESVELFKYFWIGLIALVAILQIYSLFLPVDKTAFIFVVGVSVFLCLSSPRTALGQIKAVLNSIKLLKINFALLIFVGLILVSFAHEARQLISYYDTILYHLNAVKWISTYPAIPGLGNLHTRLAFSGPFFLYASITNIGIFYDKSAHIAISLLTSVVFVQWIMTMVKREASLPQKIFCLLTLPYIVTKGWSYEMASLSTDMAMSLPLLVVFYYILSKKKEILIILGLATLSVTTKYSGMAAVFVALFYLILNARKLGAYGKELIFSILVVGLMGVGFLARNAVLTGWLFYPMPLGQLNLPWAMPRELVLSIGEVIKGWGRAPGGGYLDSLNLKFFAWFIPWLNANQTSYQIKIFALSLLGLLTGLSSEKYSRKMSELGKEWKMLLIFAFLGIVLNIFQAPLLRFSAVFFWILFALSYMPFILIFWEENYLGKFISLAIPAILMISIAGFGPKFDTGYSFRVLDKDSSFPVKTFVASPRGEKPELTIWIPKDGDLCGNSSIPCAPKPIQLRQRVPGDIYMGFLPVK